jgi:futalosine hydrolase
MKALLVTATTFEVQPTILEAGFDGDFSSRLGTPGDEFSLSQFDCLVTGVGQLQCAAWLSKVLSQRRYDVVVQAGIAGSFTDRYPHRSVVLVEEEIVSDLGAETPKGFLDIFEMGLVPPATVLEWCPTSASIEVLGGSRSPESSRGDGQSSFE